MDRRRAGRLLYRRSTATIGGLDRRSEANAKGWRGCGGREMVGSARGGRCKSHLLLGRDSVEPCRASSNGPRPTLHHIHRIFRRTSQSLMLLWFSTFALCTGRMMIMPRYLASRFASALDLLPDYPSTMSLSKYSHTRTNKSRYGRKSGWRVRTRR